MNAIITYNNNNNVFKNVGISLQVNQLINHKIFNNNNVFNNVGISLQLNQLTNHNMFNNKNIISIISNVTTT